MMVVMVVVTPSAINLVANFKEERSRKERLPAFFAMSASPFHCNEFFYILSCSHASCNSSSSSSAAAASSSSSSSSSSSTS